MSWLLALCVPLWLLGWALCRMSARQDAEEAQRELGAEQADDRAIAENLDI